MSGRGGQSKKSSFELRPITPLHVADVAAAEKEIFTNEAWNESMIEYSVKAEPVSFFGAFDGSVLMGYACLEIAFETAYLSNIAVKPVFRRKGVGELLLRRCAVVAADRGALRIVLDVRKSNFAAIALYKKAGYTEVCLRKILRQRGRRNNGGFPSGKKSLVFRPGRFVPRISCPRGKGPRGCNVCDC